jgi:small subunit ribosomal protein S18
LTETEIQTAPAAPPPEAPAAEAPPAAPTATAEAPAPVAAPDAPAPTAASDAPASAAVADAAVAPASPAAPAGAPGTAAPAAPGVGPGTGPGLGAGPGPRRPMGDRPPGGPRRSTGSSGGRREYRGRYTPRRKVCSWCADKIPVVDYKDVGRIRRYLSERGKIEPRRKTGTCARHQRALAVAIKRARHVALLPFTGEHMRVSGMSVR